MFHENILTIRLSRSLLINRKLKTMPAIDSGDSSISWRKASRSVGNGECVELSSASGRIFIRDSKAPDGPVLSYHAEAFRFFLAAAKEDVFPR
jgi:Domain of unknown function (DUF397)